MSKSTYKFIALTASFVCVIFGYQNCSETGFSTAKNKTSSFSNGMGGQVLGMDSNGNINGEITLTQCPASGCPDTLDVDIQADDNGKKTPVGDTDASVKVPVDENGVDPSDLPVTYTFTFTVSIDYKCDVIVVYVTNPNDGSQLQLSVGNSFAQWGGSCDGNVSPLVAITDSQQDGAHIAIQGECMSGTGLDVIADAIGGSFDNNVSCEGGVFNYCARIDKHGNNIPVQINQTLNSQTATDGMTFNVNIPGQIPLEITKVTISGHTATTTVKCMPGAKVTFNIYNQDQAKVDCDSDGEITQNITLVNTSNRILYVTQTTPFGVTITVQIDVDANNHMPSCAIASTTADNFCADRSGTVSGSCEAGWPVYVSVDGKLQDVVICSGQGQFSAEKVILSDDTGGSNVSIEQINPLNNMKKCSDSKSMSQF